MTMDEKSMNQNKIYFVRHGENLANLRGMLSSRIVDFSLTERGRLQASQTADYFREHKIDAIYASPLKRAIETAEFIARPHGLSVGVRESFREVYTGELEDRPDSPDSWREWGRITQAWRSGQVELAFPGGESLVMVRERVRAGLEEILSGQDGKVIVIVTHIGLLMSTIGDLCPGADHDMVFAKESQNCAITEIDLRREAGCWKGDLVLWSDYTHLQGDAANFTPPLVHVED